MAVDLTGSTASHQTEAVIVSTARTPIGKAYRGALNATPGATLGAHAVAAAVERSGLDPTEIDDVVMGGSLGEGTTGMNISRQVVLRAGLPVETAGVTINGIAAPGCKRSRSRRRVIVDGATAVVAGGLESISLVQNEHLNRYMVEDPWLVERKPENLHEHDRDRGGRVQTLRRPARRAGCVALESQRRTAAAQAAGRFDDEIVPITTDKLVVDRNGCPTTSVSRSNATNATAPTPPRRLSPAFRPVIEGGCVTAGNASASSPTEPPPAWSWTRKRPSAAASNRSACSAVSRRRDASPTRWASDRSSPCRSCSNGFGL